MCSDRRRRAFERLQQLAREERAAVACDDAGALCRISDLIGPAVSEMQGALPAGVNIDDPAYVEILRAHRAAEEYLAARMAMVADQLRSRSLSARTVAGYRQPASALTGRVERSG